jgi:predicted small secreted protein
MKENSMKRTIGVIVGVCLMAAFVAGCASAPPASEGIQKARNGAPSGTLVVSATEKDIPFSERAAKEVLARALTTITTSIIRDAATANEITNDAAGELVNRTTNAISRSQFNSAIKQGQGTGKGNVAWTVYYMEKTDVVAEINRAVNAAKQEVPNSANFSINSRIDEKYQAAIGRTWSN